MSTPPVLSPDAVQRALSLRDLTDPASGPHAMQLLVEQVTRALAGRWGAHLVIHRAHPVVPVAHNYDRLRYPAGAAARDARYTRYVTGELMLRSHTSAMIPPLLEQQARAPARPADVLLACPGLVYRRDCIDRLHTGEPHQMDLWRIATGARALGPDDLQQMIELAVAALIPGAELSTPPAAHPYTTRGREIQVRPAGSGWVEVGECGLAHPEVLRGAGLDPARTSGLAMGLGLDRLLMLRKGIDDIRLLRSSDPRVLDQMRDLAPYRQVSAQPAVRRDLSIAVPDDTTAEELGDRVRASLGDDVDSVEQVAVAGETGYADLPAAAIARMGMRPGHKNVVVTVVLRHLERSLTSAEANALRDRIYRAIHQGERHEWASDPPAGRR